MDDFIRNLGWFLVGFGVSTLFDLIWLRNPIRLWALLKQVNTRRYNFKDFSELQEFISGKEWIVSDLKGRKDKN